MYAIDFISDFSVDPIAEPDTTLAQLLQQTEKHNTTLTLTTSKRGLMNQVPKEAIAETLAIVKQHPRLLPVGILDPRHYLGWQEDLRTCVEGGCVAIRMAPGPQGWSPNTLIFRKMAEAVGQAATKTPLPLIVDFNGAGKEALDWIHLVAETTQRAGVPVVLNEVSYGYLGELITVMQEYDNVYAAIRWLCLADGLEVLVEAGVGQQLLYGSNAPKYSITGLRNQVLMARLSDEQKQAILGGNALRLLGKDIEELGVARGVCTEIPLQRLKVVTDRVLPRTVLRVSELGVKYKLCGLSDGVPQRLQADPIIPGSACPIGRPFRMDKGQVRLDDFGSQAPGTHPP